MRILCAALCALLLAACHVTPPPPPLDPLVFNGPTYTFNVEAINIAQDYRSPRTPPNVEHLSDILPAKAVRQWAGTRLIAAGHMGTLEVAIKNASIVRKDIPKEKTGIVGYFTNEQTENYDCALEVELKIYGPKNRLPIARTSVTVERSTTLPENASVIDRERLYHNLTLDLMKALEAELDANIRQYLGKYLI